MPSPAERAFCFACGGDLFDLSEFVFVCVCVWSTCWWARIGFLWFHQAPCDFISFTSPAMFPNLRFHLRQTKGTQRIQRGYELGLGYAKAHIWFAGSTFGYGQGSRLGWRSLEICMRPSKSFDALYPVFENGHAIRKLLAAVEDSEIF